MIVSTEVLCYHFKTPVSTYHVLKSNSPTYVHFHAIHYTIGMIHTYLAQVPVPCLAACQTLALLWAAAEAPLSGDDGRPVQEGGRPFCLLSCPPGRPESGDVPEPANVLRNCELAVAHSGLLESSVQPLGSGGAPSPYSPSVPPWSYPTAPGTFQVPGSSPSLVARCLACGGALQSVIIPSANILGFPKGSQALPFVLTLDRPDFVSCPPALPSIPPPPDAAS